MVLLKIFLQFGLDAGRKIEVLQVPLFKVPTKPNGMDYSETIDMMVFGDGDLYFVVHNSENFKKYLVEIPTQRNGHPGLCSLENSADSLSKRTFVQNV